jgi:hypothetical protein
VISYFHCDAALGRLLLEIKVPALDDEVLACLWPFSDVLLEDQAFVLHHLGERLWEHGASKAPL